MTSLASPEAVASATPRLEWLSLDRQLCFALYSASLSMTKLYKPLLDPLKLTYPQYLVLLALWQRDGVAVGELGARLFLDSGTLTPLLKRLQAAGLVTRERAAADERRVVIGLTPAGRRLRRKALHIPPQIGAGTQCSIEELASMTRQLQQLRSRLQGSHSATATAAL